MNVGRGIAIYNKISDDMLCEVRFYIPPTEQVLDLSIVIEGQVGEEEARRRCH